MWSEWCVKVRLGSWVCESALVTWRERYGTTRRSRAGFFRWRARWSLWKAVAHMRVVLVQWLAVSEDVWSLSATGLEMWHANTQHALALAREREIKEREEARRQAERQAILAAEAALQEQELAKREEARRAEVSRETQQGWCLRSRAMSCGSPRCVCAAGLGREGR